MEINRKISAPLQGELPGTSRPLHHWNRALCLYQFFGIRRFVFDLVNKSSTLKVLSVAACNGVAVT